MSADIIGIGAINHDHIVTTSQMRRLEDETVEGWFTTVQTDREQVTSDIAILEPIRRLDEKLGHGMQHAIGGSALNALSAVGSLGLDLNLAFVGVAGRMEHPSLSVKRHLHKFGIDPTWVTFEEQRRSGVCVSVMLNGDRVLTTAVGANAGMAQHLLANFDDLVATLSRARVIHVSSLLDEESEKALASLVETVAGLPNPPLISVDPGSVWVKDPSAAVQRLLARADLLMLNELEFQTLGDHRIADDDRDVASRILARCGEGTLVLLLKRTGSSTVFVRSSGGVLKSFDYPHPPIAASAVEDATGAGDYFAAGVLATIGSTPSQARIGTPLGAALARAKLEGKTGTEELAATFGTGLGGSPTIDHLGASSNLEKTGSSQLTVISEASQRRTSLVRSSRYPRWAGPLDVLLELPSYLFEAEVSAEVRLSRAGRTDTYEGTSASIDLTDSEIEELRRIEIRAEASDIAVQVHGDVGVGLEFEVAGADANMVTGVAIRLSERLDAEARSPRFPIRLELPSAAAPVGLLLGYLTPSLELLPHDGETRWRRFWGPATAFGILGLILAVIAIVLAL